VTAAQFPFWFPFAVPSRNCPQVQDLSLAKMLAGAIAFEISDIQEDESEAALARRSNVTMLHWVENGWMEFSRSTDILTSGKKAPERLILTKKKV
jgi:hypothetical protein